MANIYLISPPYESVYKGINARKFGVRQPPLGLAYIASFLEKRGHSVKLFDISFSRDIFGDIKSHLFQHKPEFVGITATTPQIAEAFAIAEYIKGIDPSVKIILGGPHVSALPDEAAANPYIDIVVIGEGEMTLSEILEGKNLDDIKGIAFRKDSDISINPQRPLIEDLDSLPFPSWEQLPVNEYYYFPEKAIDVISGRGCPYRCSFCASGAVHRNRYRVRSPRNFVNELEWIYDKFGIKYFFFVDETFTINYDRIGEICSLIVEEKLPIRWTCDTRVNRLNREILKVMKEAGCHNVRIGIESADERVLKATGKDITLEQAEEVVSWANELGIKTTAYYLLGLPYETPESLERTLRFAKKLKTDLAHFTMLVPLPGSPVWDIVKEGELLRRTTSDWRDYIRYDKAIVESDTLSTGELLKYHRKMVRSYFLNPDFIFRKMRSINSLKELGEYARGGLTVLKMVTPGFKN